MIKTTIITVCDRCGEVVATDGEVPPTDREPLFVFRWVDREHVYNDLCATCHRVCVGRFEDAGPIRGMRDEDGLADV